MGLVSVIIPAYNSAKFVGGAIESVLAQTTDDFEIIVVDDGSKDATPRAIEPFLADSRIRYFRQENRGLPGARNAGAKVSRGEYLAFLDADDFLAPNALEAMRKKFEESGAAWLNVGVMKLEGENRTFRRPQFPEGDLLLAILENDFITRSPFYPRKDFFEIGMYDEEIRMREDWDINIRMIAAGKPFVLLDEPLYLYTRTEGSITTSSLHKLFFYTEKLLQKHHKILADGGNKDISRLYASNMWWLAHRYFYEARDYREALRCVSESMRYDMNFYRLFHPLIHRIELLFGKT
jgi:glycosyltransferase involved in cell wall biosynthesis